MINSTADRVNELIRGLRKAGLSVEVTDVAAMFSDISLSVERSFPFKRFELFDNPKDDLNIKRARDVGMEILYYMHLHPYYHIAAQSKTKI